MENTEGVNFLFVLLFGTAAMLILAVAMISFVLVHQRRVIKHQQEIQSKDEQMQMELLRATIQSQEDEQRRIAANLHDDVGILLSTLRLKIFQVKNLMQENGLDVNRADELKDMLDTAITGVRSISHEMLPANLDKLGLSDTLEGVCNKISNEKLEVAFIVSQNYVPVSVEIELALYRVTTELLNNIIKHSGASKAEVRLSQSDGEVELKVSDNGNGFDVRDMNKQAGLGLKNIQSRLKAVNADLVFNSSSAGTTAIIKVIDQASGRV